MKSFVAVALCLSLIGTFATARIPHSYRDLQERDEQPNAVKGVLNWTNKLFKREIYKRETCYQDEFYNFVFNSSFGSEFCEDLGVAYPERTVVVDFTPVVTQTVIVTFTDTAEALVRTTPVTTVQTTVTEVLNRRDAQITPEPRGASGMQAMDFINMFRRQADNATILPTDDNVIATSFRSACSCQQYPGSTLTETYTNQPNVVTRFGFDRTTTTVFSTRVDRELTTTVTITERISATQSPASPSGEVPAPETNSTTPAVDPPVISGTVGGGVYASASGGVAVQTTGVSQGTPVFPEPSATIEIPPADPTAPPFTCPDDNGSTISQMLGTERFDYDVFCDMDLPNSPNIPVDLSYSSLSECVAACSLTNRQFNSPVCQGAVYFELPGTNCFLKSGANVTDAVTTFGTDIAILKRIAVGIDADTVDGTNTQTIVFNTGTPVANASEIAASIATMMGNSTTQVPMVTPPIGGRPALDGVTAYSTYISEGETFSTGSVFSNYSSGNGSWFSAYYSTWSLAWTSASTIYGISETAIPIVTNNTGVTQEFNGGNGGWSIISSSNTTTTSYQSNQTVFDTTEIVGNNTYDANGTEIFATTTTNYYSFTIAAEGAGSGGEGAGVVTSTAISTFSFETVVYSSGFTGGAGGGFASGGQVVQTPTPILTSTSAFSTQTVIVATGGASGSGGGEGGGSGGSDEGSGLAVTSTPIPVLSTQSVILGTGGLSGSGGGGGPGGSGSIGVPVNGTSGITGTAASGAITSTIFGSSVIIITGGTSGATAGAGSGGDSGNSTDGNFSNTSRPRTGSQDEETPPPATESIPSPTGPGPYVSLSTTPSLIVPPANSSPSVPTGTAPSTVPVPTGSSSTTFSFANPSGPRNPGTESSLSATTLTGTGPSPYPPLSTAPSGVIPPLNTTFSPSTGTAPIGTVPLPPLSTGPSGYVPPVNSSLPVPSGTAPPTNQTLPAPTGSSSTSFTFANPSGPRNPGTESSSTVSVTSRPPIIQTLIPPPSITGASSAFSTSGFSNGTISIPFPTAPPTTSCPLQAISTTTMWETKTMYFCNSQCSPNDAVFGGYGPPGDGIYRGPQSFGPPAGAAGLFIPTITGDLTPEPTSTAGEPAEEPAV